MPTPNDTKLAARAPTALSTHLVSPATAANVRRSLSERTLAAYKSDWADFRAWCGEQRRSTFPASPAVVADYLSARGDPTSAAPLKFASLKRRVAAIAFAHKGQPDPTKHELVHRTLEGIARHIGVAQAKKRPVTADKLQRLLAAVPATTLLNRRNRAILLLGFATGMRRSELCALDMEHVRRGGAGLIFHLVKSKTDQKSIGRDVPVSFVGGPACPITALRDWCQAAGVKSGPIFRALDPADSTTVWADRLSPAAVNRVVKSALRASGMREEAIKDFGAHSLRAGHVTQAMNDGASATAVMGTTGHKRVETVLGYWRRENPFTGSAADVIAASLKGKP